MIFLQSCLVVSKNSSGNIIDLLQKDWSFFSNRAAAEKILSFVLEACPNHINSISQNIDYSEEIYDNINYWDILKGKLKSESRYITDINYLINDLGWDGFFESQTSLRDDERLYRARVHHCSQNVYDKSDMKAPPAKNSVAGRANPMGIPYLYLSDNEDTVLHEIRASLHDEISLATFIKGKTCKEKILLADFTESPYLYVQYNVGIKIKSVLLKQRISKDLSKPIRRYDSELDYIPTQFICEFIKLFTNVKGIKFLSSLHSGGINFVLFEQDLVDCVSVNRIKITEKIIKSQSF
ncbi:hypothetical protein B9T10_03540 [Wohlfahrtiimonas chitiniclastica]|uniref:RES family NAD+ phosphorylase n=1 Tax=Wohlfahrtiimonas chitiniclastica TaxID=400946 RepID=UPI000B996488|nr:RES family NAD+ phosphorylase [Wohlfahrtiimonas chitiniclastica]OYQ90404.1 hypothetical protein B9T10_03540 [Wohlfahrtiimonas chitiniclastica]